MREKAKTEADVEKLPVPAGWRLLIMPYEPPSTTKGGIEIPDLVLERERLATVVGCVLAIGPDAYSDEKRSRSRSRRKKYRRHHHRERKQK